MEYYYFQMVGAVILILLSNENNNLQFLNIDPPEIKDYIFIYFLRFWHIFVFLYFSFYFLFFYGIGKEIDRYIYFISIFITIFGWNIFNGCWITQLELICYDVDFVTVKNTYNPSFYCLFGSQSDTVAWLSGWMYIITFLILLYFTDSISILMRTFILIVVFILYTNAFYHFIDFHQIIKHVYNKVMNQCP
jgi:hypothetical protein